MNQMWNILPSELKANIYQFDDTYKEKMKKEVLVDLWETKWTYWINTLECQYEQFVMNYLFQSWKNNGYCKKYIFRNI